MTGVADCYVLLDRDLLGSDDVVGASRVLGVSDDDRDGVKEVVTSEAAESEVVDALSAGLVEVDGGESEVGAWCGFGGGHGLDTEGAR